MRADTARLNGRRAGLLPAAEAFDVALKNPSEQMPKAVIRQGQKGAQFTFLT
jgi:hypothetical protein